MKIRKIAPILAMAAMVTTGAAACEPSASGPPQGPTMGQMVDMARAHSAFNGGGNCIAKSYNAVYWSGHDWSMEVYCVPPSGNRQLGYVYANWDTSWTSGFSYM